MSRAYRGASDVPRVAYQGAPGAFSEAALLEHFGGRAEPVPCRDFEGVGSAILENRAEYGVLPVENSLAGSVQGSQDVLLSGNFAVSGEIVTAIRHCLLGVPSATVEGVTRILSHPVALAQCTRYLGGQPGAEAVAVYDTAGAAREVAERADPSVAAIAARSAADRYGLDILDEDLQDRGDNQTRFYVVQAAPVPGGAAVPGPSDTAPSDGAARRTVLAVELEHRPGALLRILAPFARRGINLTRLESRPFRAPWRYRFLIELCTPTGTTGLSDALAEASRSAVSLRNLGSFVAKPDPQGAENAPVAGSSRNTP